MSSSLVPPTSPRPASTLWAPLHWLLWVVTLAWLGEHTVAFLRERPASTYDYARGAAAGLFLAIVTGTLLSLPLALALRSLSDGRGERTLTRLWGRLRSWLWEGTAEAHRARGAALLTPLCLGLGYAVVAVLATRELVLVIARPLNIAIAALGVHVSLAAVFLALRRGVEWLLTQVLTSIAKIPGFRWWLDRVGRLALAIAAGSTVVLGLVAHATREVLAVLPWQPVGVLVGAMAIAGVLAFLDARRVSRRRRLIFGATAGFAALTTGWIGWMLPHDVPTAHRAMVTAAPSRLGLSVVSWVLDIDGDGHTAGFGGGDCAPFDPSRHPAALEIPGNGIDDNCDGEDLQLLDEGDDAGLVSYPVPPAWPRRGPIVLITVDAFNTRFLEAHGAERPFMPTVEKLARDGVFFTNCFAQGPSTRLSVPSLLTSLYDSQVARKIRSRWPHPLQEENYTLAELLSDHGYRTAAVVPHEYFTPRRWPGLQQGFDLFDDEPAKKWSKRASHNAPLVVDRAEAIINRRSKKPLFLWVHFYDLHAPLREPPGTPKADRTPIEIYATQLAFMDAQLKRLLDKVTERLKDPLVILTADHGYAFDEPRHAKRRYGQDLSTAVLHVPMIFAAPYLAARAVDSLCSTMDIAPTLANLLRVDKPVPFRGRSLVPAFTHGLDPRPRTLFHQFFLPEQTLLERDPLWYVSARTADYNLVFDRTTGNRSAWKWTEDFEERNDLWGNPRNADEREALEQLRRQLDVFIFKTVGSDAERTQTKVMPSPEKERKKRRKQPRRSKKAPRQEPAE